MFTEIVNSILSTIQDFIGYVVERILEGMTYVAEQIKSAIELPFSTILSTVSGMVSWFSSEILNSIQSGFSYISRAFMSTLGGAVQEMLNRFTDIQSMFHTVRQMIIETAGQVNERIAEMAGSIGERMREGFTAFGEKMERMASSFREAIQGAIDAISRTGDAVINLLTNTAVLLKAFLERIIEILANMSQYLKSLFELNPDEILRIAVETQKALLGLGPWLQSQA